MYAVWMYFPPVVVLPHVLFFFFSCRIEPMFDVSATRISLARKSIVAKSFEQRLPTANYDFYRRFIDIVNAIPQNGS